MEDMKEKMREFITNNIRKIAIFLVVLIAIIIGAVLLFGNKYHKYESEMIELAKPYFSNTTSNYVTLKKLNKKYNGCQDYSGVYNDNGVYTAYLFCEDYTTLTTTKKITLNGGNPIVLKTSDIYQEQGYISDYTIEVINTYKQQEGAYFISYIARENNKRIAETKRMIIVDDTFNSSNSIVLSGSKEMTIFKDESYSEPGYHAYDELGNDITSSVVVNGNINTTKVGKQQVTYTVNVNNYKTMTAERIVNVLDVSTNIELETENPTLKENTINLIATGKDYEYTILPDGSQTKERVIEYKVNKNNNYSFKIYSNNKYKTETITVSKIYQEITGTCTINQNASKTIFTDVVASGGYGELQYSYLDKTNYTTYTKNTNYAFNNKLNTTSIKIKDSINNVKTITCSNPSIKIDKLEVHFIKISNGRYDAILFKLGDKTLFVDGGLPEHYSQIDAYLKKLGVDHIDIIIGSHGHNNHVGPQAEIIRNYNVKEAYYNQDIYNCIACESKVYNGIIKALSEKNVKPNISRPGDVFYFGDVKFETIAPLINPTESENPYSTNYIITFEGTKMMITGDGVSASKVLEKYSKEMLDVDIFKYPHHGQHPLSKEYLKTINPEYVVFTANTSSNISSSTKRILNEIGSKIYTHYEHGNIVIIIGEGNIQFKTNVDPSTFKID